MNVGQLLFRICFPLAMATTVAGCAGLGPGREGPTRPVIRVAEPATPEQDAVSDEMYEVLAAELAGRLGDVSGAVAHYTHAARLSDDPRIAERATRVALFAGALKEAIESGKRWEQLAPDDPEAQQTLALLYVRSGHPERAVPYLERLVAVEHGEGNRFLAAAAVLAGAEDRAKALDAMAKLVARHPTDPRAQLALATLALKLEDYPAAVRASDRALALDPHLGQARVIRAQGLLKQGATERALESMAQAVREDPQDFELQFTYGRMLVQAQRYGQARKLFERLLREHPRHSDLLYTLGLLNLQEGRYTSATRYFKRLAATAKRKDEAYYYLGRIDEDRKRYRQALDWYRQVGEGEYLVDAQARIGIMLARLGEWAEVREHFKTLRDRASDENTLVRLYLAEGQVLRDAGRYQEAFRLYSRALTEHPNNADLLYARALIAEKLDRVDLLEQDLKAILARDPNNATALNALGYTLAERNLRLDEALAYIRRALELKPDDPTVMDSMGWVQYRLGHYEEAEKYLRKAYSRLQDPEIAGHLSELLWHQGRRAEALSLLRAAMEKNPEDDALRRLKQRLKSSTPAQTPSSSRPDTGAE